MLFKVQVDLASADIVPVSTWQYKASPPPSLSSTISTVQPLEHPFNPSKFPVPPFVLRHIPFSNFFASFFFLGQQHADPLPSPPVTTASYSFVGKTFEPWFYFWRKEHYLVLSDEQQLAPLEEQR